jgi:hypothetical protein
MVLSDRFHARLREELAKGERQYRLARRARVHPTTVSQIRHDALPLRQGDERVVRLGRLLGLEPDECFATGGDSEAA